MSEWIQNVLIQIRQSKKLFWKIIGIVLSLFFVFAITIGLIQRTYRTKYESRVQEGDQACLNQNYREAIQSYMRALEYSQADVVVVVKKLSDAYIGAKEYEQAAQVLQEYYIQTKDNRLKEDIISVFQMIIEKDYSDRLKKGETYLKNSEYERAVNELEKAMQLKPKEIEPVEFLVTAYIRQGDPDTAKKLLAETQKNYTPSQIKELNQSIQEAIVAQRYEALLTKADEYFQQESYTESFNTYREAIKMCPTNLSAYESIVEAYESLRQYDRAINLLEASLQVNKMKALNDLLKQCKELKRNESIRFDIFERLYEALNEKNCKRAIKIIKSKEYQKYIKCDHTVYYSKDSSEELETIPSREGMAIYSNGYIYCGEFTNGVRSGEGVYFSTQNNKLGYSIYSGLWKEDMPNGTGMFHGMVPLYKKGKHHVFEVIITGNYHDGLEDGDMKREFFVKSESVGTCCYQAAQGEPISAISQINEKLSNVFYSYIIGTIEYKGKEWSLYYSREDGSKRYQIPGL